MNVCVNATVNLMHPEQVSEQFYHDCADAFYTTYYGFTPASYE